MIRYFFRRLLWMIPVVLGVTILVFLLMSICPGDPIAIIAGTSASPEDMAVLRETLGLNDPLIIRLGRFLSDFLFHFDFGTSWITSEDIMAAMIEKMPRTMGLGVATLFLSVLFGIPLGIMAAVKQGGLGDNLCMTVALAGISIPGFWLAMLLILLFSVQLGWLPPFGTGSIRHYILPALAGCTGGIATLARQTRSSMLDVIRSDYITTARSKGVREFVVIVKHAFKNALIPVITTIGIYFGRLLGGTMIIETIFSIPGMGSFIITAVNNRDYPVVQAGAIFLAIVFSLCMLMVDMLYALADPRIKAQYASRGGKKRA